VRSPPALVTCRTIVPLMTARCTRLSVRGSAEGIWRAALSVASVTRLSVPGAAEEISPAALVIAPATRLTG
jgi:hypothetical protein